MCSTTQNMTIIWRREIGRLILRKRFAARKHTAVSHISDFRVQGGENKLLLK